MRDLFAIAGVVFMLLVVPPETLGKGATTKIVIEGVDLAKPVVITDREKLAKFNVWAGPGTFSTQPGFAANAPSFIVDWWKGPVGPPPGEVRKYRVSFYSEKTGEKPIYIVDYVIGDGLSGGYVYLPGKSDDRWRLNVSSIVHGVEGQWFHAWSAWERVAKPMIEKAHAGQHVSR